MIQRKFRTSDNRKCSWSQQGIATYRSFPFQLSVSSWDFIVLCFFTSTCLLSFSAVSLSPYHEHVSWDKLSSFKCFPIKLLQKSLTRVLWLQVQLARRESDWLSLTQGLSPGPTSCAGRSGPRGPSTGIEETAHWEGGRERWRQSD